MFLGLYTLPLPLLLSHKGREICEGEEREKGREQGEKERETREVGSSDERRARAGPVLSLDLAYAVAEEPTDVIILV